MTHRKRREARLASLRRLYPQLNEEELQEADHNLQRYLENAVRIAQRLEHDPEAMARFRALKRASKRGTKKDKGRSVSERNQART